MGLISSVFSVAIWLYFVVIFIQVAAFIINLKDFAPSSLSPYLPYSIDETSVEAGGLTTSESLLRDVTLLAFFALPHTIFARPALKSSSLGQGLGNMYRSMYVLQSTIAIHLICKYWAPINFGFEKPLWAFEDGSLLHRLLLGTNGFGFLWTLTSTFAIDHMELFGVSQGTGTNLYKALGIAGDSERLITRCHYALCRHPIMFGFFVMFFATPVMTMNHMFFAAACTVYILGAVTLFEEPDLRKQLGTEYEVYASRVPAYCPFARLGKGSGVRDGVELKSTKSRKNKVS
jgi:hypothetical protein